MKVEWTYIFLVCIATYMCFTMPAELNPIYFIFLLVGLIITYAVFAIPTVEMTVGSPQNFLVQMGLGNLILGLPALKGIPPTIPLSPASIFIAISAEEVYRVGSALWLYGTLQSAPFAAVMSAIVFGAMHMYWDPAGWIYAIIGGFALSFLLFTFGSETACIGTHLLVDLLMFRYIPIWLFLIISLGMVMVYFVKKPTIGWEET